MSCERVPAVNATETRSGVFSAASSMFLPACFPGVNHRSSFGLIMMIMMMNASE